MSRTFTVATSSVGKTGGNYHAEAPYNAAKKAGRRLLMDAKESRKTCKSPSKKASPCSKKSPSKAKMCKRTTVTFTLEEKVGRKRVCVKHTYKTTRVKKSKPQVFTLGGVEIVSKYDYHTETV